MFHDGRLPALLGGRDARSAVPLTAFYLVVHLDYILAGRAMERLSRNVQLGIGVAAAAVPLMVPMSFPVAGLFGNLFFFLFGLTYKAELTAVVSRDPWLGSAAAGVAYVALVAGAVSLGIPHAPVFDQVTGLVGIALFIFASRIVAGQVAVNGIVKTDPRLPSGGVKRSGLGRELGPHGIKEFVNAQQVWKGPRQA